MTSPEEFPEEVQVPPVFVDTPTLALGSIVTFKQTDGGDLRLPVTLRDDNVGDLLYVRAQLSVVGQQPYAFFCSDTDVVATTGEPNREPVDVVFASTELKPRACTLVELFASTEFVRKCDDKRAFTVSVDSDDLATARMWVWEMSGDPSGSGPAAIDLVTSCQTTVTRAQTPSATMMVP
ncbi:MAG TPA: hypothetical protein VJR89_10910 [Polyangiales bacterium]|nr:hypothetical protein [Polyangiales bacterium]